MSEQIALFMDRARAVQEAIDGMERASRAERVQAWKQAAAAWFSLLTPGEEIVADDLIAAIGLPDQGVAKNNVVGAIFSAQSKSGRLRFSGRFQKSERVIGHGNLQRIWIVT